MPTALPLATDFTGASITEAQFKTAITSLRDYLAGLLNTTGSGADALLALNTLFSSTVAKSAAYTAVAADRGRLLDCTGTWTLAFTAAATLGNGFVIAVRNSGAGVITLDPSASELIDGAATLALNPGDTCFVVCNGSGFSTVARTIPPSYPISIANGGTGSTTASAALAALGGVSKDAGFDTVGSFAFAYNSSGLSITAGSIYAGSSLLASGLLLKTAPGIAFSGGVALSGTYRCLGSVGVLTGYFPFALFQRIA